MWQFTLKDGITKKKRSLLPEIALFNQDGSPVDLGSAGSASGGLITYPTANVVSTGGGAGLTGTSEPVVLDAPAFAAGDCVDVNADGALEFLVSGLYVIAINPDVRGGPASGTLGLGESGTANPDFSFISYGNTPLIVPVGLSVITLPPSNYAAGNLVSLTFTAGADDATFRTGSMIWVARLA